MGCISFSVISLSAYTLNGEPSTAKIAWARGIALIIGIVSAVVINWVIWPFVARHELRKSLSFMMLNLGISYRGVVARFVLYLFSGGAAVYLLTKWSQVHLLRCRFAADKRGSGAFGDAGSEIEGRHVFLSIAPARFVDWQTARLCIQG